MNDFEIAKMAVVDLLQKNGALDTIKAQLRSSVFLALQATSTNQAKSSTDKLGTFLFLSRSSIFFRF